MTLRTAVRDILYAFTGTREARDLRTSARSASHNFLTALANVTSKARNVPPPSDAPLFILSAGWRSGSTFLQRLTVTSNRLIWGEPYHFSEPVQRLQQQFTPFGDPDWPSSSWFAEAFPLDSLHQEWIANLYPRTEALVNAHRAFLDQLFAMPARELGYSEWGIKEVHWDTHTAAYLQWIYPNAKFIFLVRNPLDAWRSYRAAGRRWFWHWPNEPIMTPTAFGGLWARLANDFLLNHKCVNGILVRYEDLTTANCRATLEEFLDAKLFDPTSLPWTGKKAGRGSDLDRDAGALLRLERRLVWRKAGPVGLSYNYALY
jgi:hypothetical protein